MWILPNRTSSKISMIYSAVRKKNNDRIIQLCLGDNQNTLNARLINRLRF